MPQYPSRIVCLTEETTETLYLLGMGDCVVGVSGYTARPAEAREKPRVSAFTHARYDRIEQLKPDLILGCADRAEALAASLQRNLDEVQEEGTRFAFRPRVFFEEWDDPLISGIRWVEELIAIA